MRREHIYEKKFNSFRNRQNGFEDLGSGTAEAAKRKKLVEGTSHHSCDSGNRYFYF